MVKRLTREGRRDFTGTRSLPGVSGSFSSSSAVKGKGGEHHTKHTARVAKRLGVQQIDIVSTSHRGCFVIAMPGDTNTRNLGRLERPADRCTRQSWTLCGLFHIFQHPVTTQADCTSNHIYEFTYVDTTTSHKWPARAHYPCTLATP